ncbi:MAG: hypothetical protein C0508_23080 [Cyanobacteria bacterium PR.023]|jgi:hypothetical protein|nr:hypothetical protein [Cyanobacteria bacterium PR.023]
MFDSMGDALTLLCRGQLVRNFGTVVVLAITGNLIAAILMMVMFKAGLSLLIAVPVASLVAGALQPWLFKDIKFH